MGGLRCVVDVVSGTHIAWGTQCMGIAGSLGFWSERVEVRGIYNAWGLQCVGVAMYEGCTL